MINFIGLENIIYLMLAFIIVMAYLLDRFSRHAIKHIDKLQNRVSTIEGKMEIVIESLVGDTKEMHELKPE